MKTRKETTCPIELALHDLNKASMNLAKAVESSDESNKIVGHYLKLMISTFLTQIGGAETLLREYK